MSINSYLTNIANAAYVRDQEKAGIQRSIDTLRSRLSTEFSGQLSDQFVFGSYSRGTILPRRMDAESDVDYMVVFSDGLLRPNSYLIRLRRFAETWYARSEIALSNPTVVLELNHIKFELVPATRDWLGTTRIPAKASAYQDWIDTDPKGFNDRLTSTNQSNSNLIKPLVRVLKYWNATAGYPFESYDLEQKIVGGSFGFYGLLSAPRLKDLFLNFVPNLSVGYFEAQWKKDAVERLRTLTAQASSLENSGRETEAERCMARLLPPVG